MKRNIYLRVKLKSLAAESKIIRAEERKANGFKQYILQHNLYMHRVNEVRRASRQTLLAYQYLRGIPYAVIEREGSSWVDLSPVVKMVNKYGKSTVTIEDLKIWTKRSEVKKAA